MVEKCYKCILHVFSDKQRSCLAVSLRFGPILVYSKAQKRVLGPQCPNMVIRAQTPKIGKF